MPSRRSKERELKQKQERKRKRAQQGSGGGGFQNSKTPKVRRVTCDVTSTEEGGYQ